MEIRRRVFRKSGHRFCDQNTRDLERLRAGVRSHAVVAVQTFAHFLAGLEKRNALLIHRHMRPGARIAAGTGRTVLHRKCPETAQFDPVATRQSRDDLIEDRIHDVLHIPLIEMRVVLGDALNEFGFDHRDGDPGSADIHFRENAVHCQAAKSNCAPRKRVTKGRIGYSGNTRNAGGSYRNRTYGVQLDPAGDQSANMPSRPRRSTACATPPCSTCRAIEPRPSASSVMEAAVRRKVRSPNRGDSLKSRTGRSLLMFFCATSHAIAVFSSPS